MSAQANGGCCCSDCASGPTLPELRDLRPEGDPHAWPWAARNAFLADSS